MAESGCLRDMQVNNLEVAGLTKLGNVTNKRPVIALTAARTVLPTESGTVFTLNSTGGAYTVTLPTVANGSGCHFTFFVAENTPTHDITITSGATNISGNIMIQADSGEDNRVACVTRTSVLVDQNALLGDSLEFFCDGTSYFVIGRGSVQGAFTVA